MRPFDPDRYPPVDVAEKLDPVANVELDPSDSGDPAPGEDLVEGIGGAIGVTYCENEPLRCGEKELQRDRHRWELDPASAEDYRDRMRSAHETDLPSEPILHMSHRGARPGRVS